MRSLLERWSQSGMMSLTGPSNGAPLVPTHDFAAPIDAALDGLQQVVNFDVDAHWPQWSMLLERAAIQQLTRGGTESCNRSCRMLAARDGWIALNLPRTVDLEMLLPWIGVDHTRGDPWSDVARTVKNLDRQTLRAAADGLDLALSDVPECVPASPRKSASDTTYARVDPPLVIDLSALWAGPLCGRILALNGARVIKVESVRRPELMRAAYPTMFDRLHAGKESVVLDFEDLRDRRRLLALLDRADIVISSARPRAFAQLGIDPQDLVAADARRIWVAITAYGWHGDENHRIGFGDDVAAAAGLVMRTPDGRPMFMGDAIADPLTGIDAATRAVRAWQMQQGTLIDASLHDSARAIATAASVVESKKIVVTARQQHWWLNGDAMHFRVHEPVAMTQSAPAAPFGAHTAAVLRELIH